MNNERLYILNSALDKSGEISQKFDIPSEKESTQKGNNLLPRRGANSSF